MITLRETMTALDGKENVSTNEIAESWSEAKRLMGNIFRSLTNEQFMSLKRGEPMEFRTGPLHRKIELYESTDAVGGPKEGLTLVGENA